MTPVGFGDISGDPTSCPPAAFPRHLNFSPLPHSTASDTHCIGACLSSQPRHPHITVSLLVSSRSFYPLPPLCSPSCFHHQLIGNLPSPLDRVSNFLFLCVFEIQPVFIPILLWNSRSKPVKRTVWRLPVFGGGSPFLWDELLCFLQGCRW